MNWSYRFDRVNFFNRSEAPKAVAVLFPDEQDTIEEEISQDVVELSGPEDNDQEGSLIKLLEAAAGGKSKAQMTSFAAKEPQSGVCPTGRYQQNTQTHPKLTSDRMNINQNALSSITPTNVEVRLVKIYYLSNLYMSIYNF